MVNIDMWYGDNHEMADKISVNFYDTDCVYRGNVYKDGKIIGDYSCNDSLEFEKAFPQLTGCIIGKYNMGVTLKEVGDARLKVVEHIGALQKQLNGILIRGDIENADQVLREYVGVIQHNIDTYNILLNQYLLQQRDA